MDGSRETLAALIHGILLRAGKTTKVKLAKLVLFCEVEHFKRTGQPMTGMYFVRLTMGPVVAFFEDTLRSGNGTLWNRTDEPVLIHELGKVRTSMSFMPLDAADPLTEDEGRTVDEVVRAYGGRSGSELSTLSHLLPAWRHSEPNEPIFVAELAVDTDEAYFAMVDIIEGIEDDDSDLDRDLPQALSRA